MRLLILAALLALATTAARAQTAIPTGTPGVLITANPNARAVRYQVQGAGYACVSWATSAIAIVGSNAAATCTGAGAYLVTAGSIEGRVYPQPTPGSPLYGVAASGAMLQLNYEVQ